jgi:protein-tyrosine-phosphatase
VIKILMVCTANICRSPFAAAVLGSRLASIPGEPRVHISSAGTKALSGAGLCGEVERLLQRREPPGGGPLAHAPSLVDASAIETADLILVMELSHRAAVARISPSARRRTFTLREAAGLAQHVQTRPKPASRDRDAAGDVRFRGFVTELNSLRGEVRPRTGANTTLWSRFGAGLADPLDIVDGHNSTSRRHRAALEQVDDATADIAAALTRLFA